MAQGLLQPEVASFLDVVSYGKEELGLILEGFVVGEDSKLDGHNLREARLREATGAYVVGVKRRDTGIIADLRPQSSQLAIRSSDWGHVISSRRWRAT